MRDRPPLLAWCRGRWPAILVALGVPAKLLNRRNQPCPWCGGKDRFRFGAHEDGLWICNVCGGGNGIGFLKRFLKTDFKGVAEAIEGAIGVGVAAPPSKTHPAPNFRGFWASGVPVLASNLAGRYFAKRGIVLQNWPESLRYLDLCQIFPSGAFHPAVLAKVSDPTGAGINIHRTYLLPDGRRERKMMPGAVPKGSHVRLSEPAEIMGIAEGIETALAAGILWNLPVWAALGTAGLWSFEPPQACRELVIFGDNDALYGGQAAAFALAHRLACAKRVSVTVQIPDRIGSDWADVLQFLPLYPAPACQSRP